MSNRPMLNLLTDALVERIASSDPGAIREAHLRLADGVMRKNERKLKVALGLEAPAPRKVRTPKAAAPAPAPKAQVAPAPAPAPAPVPAPAPTSEFSPELILAACALLLADSQTEQVSTPDPVPAPASAPAPSPKATAPRNTRKASAATVFNKRVFALAQTGNKSRMAARATKLAKRDGFTHEQVLSLSDAECLALVAEPIA